MTSHLRHNLPSFLIKKWESQLQSPLQMNLGNYISHVTRQAWERGMDSGQYQEFVINVESVDSSWSAMGVDLSPPWPLIGQMSRYWPLIGRWWPELMSCQRLMVSWANDRGGNIRHQKVLNLWQTFWIPISGLRPSLIIKWTGERGCVKTYSEWHQNSSCFYFLFVLRWILWILCQTWCFIYFYSCSILGFIWDYNWMWYRISMKWKC